VSWPTLIAIVTALVVAGAIAALVLIRERRSSRTRFGVFVEHELDQKDEAERDTRPLG
jgi:hypothetical protein